MSFFAQKAAGRPWIFISSATNFQVRVSTAAISHSSRSRVVSTENLMIPAFTEKVVFLIFYRQTIGKDICHQILKRNIVWLFQMIVDCLNGTSQLTELGICLDDGNGCLSGYLALNDGGQHIQAFLREGMWHNRRMFQWSEPVKIFDQFTFLADIQGYNVTIWEFLRIVPDGLIYFSCRYTIDLCDVTVNDDLQVAQGDHLTTYCFNVCLLHDWFRFASPGSISALFAVKSELPPYGHSLLMDF